MEITCSTSELLLECTEHSYSNLWHFLTIVFRLIFHSFSANPFNLITGPKNNHVKEVIRGLFDPNIMSQSRATARAVALPSHRFNRLKGPPQDNFRPNRNLPSYSLAEDIMPRQVKTHHWF